MISWYPVTLVNFQLYALFEESLHGSEAKSLFSIPLDPACTCQVWFDLSKLKNLSSELSFYQFYPLVHGL